MYTVNNCTIIAAMKIGDVVIFTVDFKPLLELFCLLFGFLFVSPPLRRCLDTDPENILFGTLNNRNPKIPENLLFIFSRYLSVVLLNELIAVCLGAVWTPNSL